MRRLAILVFGFALGCGPSLPAEFVKARDGAQAAYTRKKYEKSAELWLKAANATERHRDKVEAKFRAAASYERAGRIDLARRWYAEVEREPAPNERGERATYTLAELTLSHEGEERGFAALEAAILKHPSSGLARGAFLRYVEWVKAKQSIQAALDYVERTAPKVRGSELHQTTLLVRARLLEEQNKLSEAEQAFFELARLYPYPKGSYWDDALFAAAHLQELRGDYAAAVATLSSLVGERETSYISGSYERSRYAQAQFHVAELYRDRFNDFASARRAFRKTFDEYPKSTLRDDALWQEALIAKRLSDTSGICSALRVLVNELPESRFAACAPALCRELSAPSKNKKCHDYILREVQNPAPPAAATSKELITDK
jgi:TolA-binding protein